MKTDDKEIAKIYETSDYTKFSILAENRGQQATKGLKEKKIKTLQRMIDNNTWVREIALIRVNHNFEIIDGAHTYEVLKRNDLPIRYTVIDDERFNSSPKREKIGAVYSINSVTTSWSAQELFNAACQVKAPLALLMREIIEENDNYFLWTDLIGLLEKDGAYFMGRWRKANMATFERKELIEAIKSDDFKWELNYFIKLNLKARIAARKGVVLKAAYEIIWHCGELIDKKLFRKSLGSIPEVSIQSTRTASDEPCRRMLIQHYNKSQGQQAEASSVIHLLKHRDQEVLEIV